MTQRCCQITGGVPADSATPPPCIFRPMFLFSDKHSRLGVLSEKRDMGSKTAKSFRSCNSFWDGSVVRGGGASPGGGLWGFGSLEGQWMGRQGIGE